MLQKHSYSMNRKHVNIPEIWLKQNPEDSKMEVTVSFLYSAQAEFKSTAGSL